MKFLIKLAIPKPEGQGGWYIPDKSEKNNVNITVYRGSVHTIGGLGFFLSSAPFDPDKKSFKDGAKHFFAVTESIVNGLLPKRNNVGERNVLKLNDPRIVSKFEIS